MQYTITQLIKILEQDLKELEAIDVATFESIADKADHIRHCQEIRVAIKKLKERFIA